jgi:hypothetical protein
MALLIPALATLAHEGEVHEEPAAKAPPPLPGAGLQSISAMTENFEVVIKHPPLDPEKEGELTLFLSDYRTNAPVSDAQVQIDAPDAGVSGLWAERTDSPGVYKVVFKAPKQGTYSLIVNVTAGDLSDLIPMNGLTIGELEAETGPVRSGFLPDLWVGVLILLMAAGSIVWFIIQKTRRRSYAR